MAAVVPFIETQQWSFPDYGPQGLSGLGDTAKVELTEQQMIAASNIEQTRLLYTRTLLQQALAGRTFQLKRKGNDIKIELSSAFNRETIPWARSSSNIRTISLFSTNSKMRCPTFDLPAGAGVVGGTCPGALPAQTTSIGRAGSAVEKSGILAQRADGKMALRVMPSVEYNLAKAVCNYCYATGGKYGEPTVQIAELVRLSVIKAALQSSELRKVLIDAIVWQIPQLPYDRWLIGKIKKRDASGVEEDDDEETAADAEPTITEEDIETPETILARMGRFDSNVVRVHSSGDFFSPKYADMWLEIARQLYQKHGMRYILWAPTRTHVIPGVAADRAGAVKRRDDEEGAIGFAEFWARRQASGMIPPNFMIRPSAYHLGDHAPMAPGLSAGTSVLTPSDAASTKGIKYDHQCGVYDLKKGNKTCVDAIGPDGKKGCRACWVRPELRINYVAH